MSKSIMAQLLEKKQKLEESKELYKKQISDLSKKLNKVDTELLQIQEKINQNGEIEITVSDHALMRFFERQYHLHLDHVKEKLITEEIKTMVKESNGTCNIKMVEGETYVFKQYNLITILPSKN